jgi:hypothetical protein
MTEATPPGIRNSSAGESRVTRLLTEPPPLSPSHQEAHDESCARSTSGQPTIAPRSRLPWAALVYETRTRC